MVTRDIPRPSGGVESQPLRAASWLHKLLLPSVADFVFLAILFWLFFFGAGAPSLLGDGDTGWHIRAGEYILASGQFPHHDLFSFSMEGKQWFAWEWLADVLFALVHQLGGLQGIVLLAGVVIAATAAALLRFMVWQGANLLLAIMAMLAVCSASSVHWLARPHMFTWGLLLATLWLLEADRRRPSWKVYLLAPLVMIWVNVHGGFAALLVMVAIYAAGVSAEQLWEAWEGGRANRWWLPPAAKRYGLLLVVCAAGTLVNPYTYELHLHIGAYLGSDFILNNIQEFQSPDFRGESMRVFEGVLLISLVLVGPMLRRREVTSALLVLAWAHAALLSVRHVPLFMIVAAPLVARELSLVIADGARRGNPWLKILQEFADDYGGQGKAASESGPVVLNPVGLAAVAAIALMLQIRGEQPNWKAQFPAVRFPAQAADTLQQRLLHRRVLSTDQWGDYLIYRFYPEFKVFIDGRSDFYDPSIRDEYVELMHSHWGWRQVLEKHRFEAALLPVSWSLAAALKIDPQWRLVYDDGVALFFEKRSAEPLRPAAPGRGDGGLLETASLRKKLKR